MPRRRKINKLEKKINLSKNYGNLTIKSKKYEFSVKSNPIKINKIHLMNLKNQTVI